jgi:hypothetical protein
VTHGKCLRKIPAGARRNVRTCKLLWFSAFPTREFFAGMVWAYCFGNETETHQRSPFNAA